MSTAILTLAYPVDTTQLDVGKKDFIVAADFQMGYRDVKDSLVFSQERDAGGC